MKAIFAATLLIGTGLSAHSLAQSRDQPSNPSFNLMNRSPQAIREIFATPSGVDRWGQDRLTRFLVPPGETFPVRLASGGPCIYDIRITYADGRSEEKRRVDTCRLDAIAFPGGATSGQGTGGGAGGGSGRTNTQATTDDPSFRLINRSRAELNELYVSPPGNQNWGEDRLGDDTVRPGATYVVRLPKGDCTYDVRAVFANGEASEKRRIDLCAITDLRLP